jgi:hypothetical protein
MSNYKLDIKIEVQCTSSLSILQEYSDYSYRPPCKELIEDALKLAEIRGMRKEILTNLEITATCGTVGFLDCPYDKFHYYWNLDSENDIGEIPGKWENG